MSKMSVEHVADVLATYLDEQIAPKAQGLQKLGVYITGIAIARQSGQIARQYAPLLQTLGLLDDGQNIDIEAVADMARQAMGKMGNKVAAMGLIFDTSDIDILAGIAKKYAC